MYFIHGTNSSIFALLPRTAFCLKSPLIMIRDHHVAPVTGELINRGYDTIGEGTIEDSNHMGQTSFAALEQPYDLSSIIYGYAKLGAEKAKDSKNAFSVEAEKALECAFSNFNLILIYLVRARQRGYSLAELKFAKYKIVENLKALRQFYFFIQLFGSHIFPDVEKIKPEDIKSVTSAAGKQLTILNIASKIVELKLDIEVIVKNPTPDNLKKALAVLRLDSSEQCFGTVRPDDSTWTNRNYPGASYFRMSQDLSGYRINHLLEDYLTQNQTHWFFKELKQPAQQTIIAIDDRIAILNNILALTDDKILIPSQEWHFLEPNNIFPIILITENEDILEHIQYGEYRSKRALKIGEEITHIATDNEDHRRIIENYLAHYNINNVSVWLFSDLAKTLYPENKLVLNQYHHVISKQNNNKALKAQDSSELKCLIL